MTTLTNSFSLLGARHGARAALERAAQCHLGLSELFISEGATVIALILISTDGYISHTRETPEPRLLQRSHFYHGEVEANSDVSSSISGPAA